MSNKRIRAITTRYKGYAFRSRLEARFAVYFDHLGITWDYEPEGFELGNGLRYLPDFWLPDLRLWVEIKPSYPDKAGIEKATRLGQEHHAVVMFCGPPGADHHDSNLFFGWDSGESGAGFMPARGAGWFAHVDGELALEIGGAGPRTFYAKEWQHEIPAFSGPRPGVCWERARAAAAAARAARFEFGEKGSAK